MAHRALVATIVVMVVVAFGGLVAALSVILHSASPVSAQQFSTEATTREVDENTPSFQAIGDPVRATGGGNLTYSLENAGTSHFAIGSSTGQLMSGAPLDYEAMPSYTVKVIASDGSRSGSITVTVNVTNLDERGTVTLSWKQPQVSTALTASLADPDGGVSSLTWQWSRADTKNGSYSDVDAATSASYTPVDDDVDKFLRATASYTDGEGSGKTARMESYRDVRAAPSTNSAPAFPAADDISGGYDCSGTDPDRGVCLYVRRSSPVGAEIYNPARAEDPDGDEVRYSLEGVDIADFGVNPVSGNLYTKQLFRDVDKSSYSVTIKASDPSGESDTIKATIKPSGSKGPPVVEGPEDISYPENGTWQVATYTAENKHGPTGGWIVSVEPGGGDGDHFTINDEGVLTFDSPPDFEDPKDEGENNSYNFSIMAYEANPPNGQRPRQTIFSVTVVVTDLTAPEPLGAVAVDVEEAPEFPSSEPGARSVAENTPAGQNIGNAVAATDGDGDSLTYFLGGTDGGSFDIVSASGQLLTKDSVDYETKSSYSVTVSVRDSKDADGDADTATDATVTVTVTVANLEEAGTLELSATHPLVDAALTASLTDPDGSISGESWVWESSSDRSNWTAISGATVDSYTPVDDDVGSYLRVTASYTDGEASGKTAQAEAANTVATAPPANRDPAFPASETGARSVPENTPAGQNIGNPVAATDGDEDSLTYSLGGTDAGAFDIVSASGQLRTKDALDYETKSSYSVTVSVRDNKDADGNADTTTDDTITVTISVADVDESPRRVTNSNPVSKSNQKPSFDEGDNAQRSVAENAAAVTDIGEPIKASDSDNDKLTYTLGGVDGASFDIVKASGQLQTKTALDHEGKSSYEVTVTVKDPSNASDRITVTITVTDVEESPAFPADEDGARNVAENTGAGEDIGDPVAAEDDDGDSLTYTLGGDDAASFDIVASTGQLQTKAALDHESKSSHSVTVSVSDGYDSEGNTDTATDDTVAVTITVTDVEEDPEFTTGAPVVRSVAENTAAGVDIGKPVTAMDDQGDSQTYTLGGDHAASFDIAASTGQLKTKAALDYETKSSYSVTVSVSDGYDAEGNADTAVDDTVAVTITVTDVEEAPDFATGASVVRSVAENTEAGVDIGQPVAAVDDQGDSQTYTLGGDDAASFDITASTGQLKTKAALDYESKSSYSVTVSVSDGYDAEGNADTAVDDTVAVTITVTDVEEIPEFPAAETGARIVAENTGAGEDIGDPVVALDSDRDSLTYTLSGDDAASFDIVESTGQLQTKAALDYEDKSSYSVTVSVSDGYDADRNVDTAADDTITVTIMVADVAETSAFPATETGARTAAENTGAGEDIGGPVTAEDDDEDSLTYTLGGDDAASFDIVAATGQLQTKAALDYEDKSSYSVTVSVSDGYDADGNSDTATDDTITVTITVTDVEEAPEFPATETGARSVAENTAAWERIGDAVEAEDDDGDSLTYTLGGSDAASFDMVASTGRLRTRAPLDYESKSSYSVTVSVNDGYDADGNADTATDDTITVTIAVTDVEEEGEVALSSVQPQVDTQLTASIADPDGGVSGATWEWESSSDQSDWESIDGATGPGYTPVAGDVGNYLRATASYSDRRGSSKEAQEVSANTVWAAPVTNSAPEFEDDSVDREVAEHTEAGENIGDPVVATDENDDPLTYTLGEGDASSFSITRSTGQLLTKAFLDYESKSSYTVTVTATDPSGEADSIIVNIDVTDVAAPIGASIFPFVPGGDIPVVAAGNARVLDIKESPPATLAAIIMMFVGALMIAVGSYLRTWASRPQRPDYGRDRGFYFPSFSPAPAD